MRVASSSYVLLFFVCIWAITSSAQEETSGIAAGVGRRLLPTNSHIPTEELETLSAEAIPRIVKQFKIPVKHPILGEPGSAGFSSGVQSCVSAPDFSGVVRRQGCYIGVYVCDNDFSGRCFWSFKRQCGCPRTWVLKTHECRIEQQRIPLENTAYDHIIVPIGECRLAVWIWVATAAASVPVLWYIVFRSIRLVLKNMY